MSPRSCFVSLLSLVLSSCTLTTDLDFVGARPSTSSDEKVDAQVRLDADVHHDGSVHLDANVGPDAGGSSTRTTAHTVTSSALAPDAIAPNADADVAPAPQDASLDASAPDAAPMDASADSAVADARVDCVAATPLLTESYESDLSKWSSVNWQQTECQQTDIAQDTSVDSAHSVRSRIECQADEDHLHFTSIQLLDAPSQTPTSGMNAPNGLLLSFSAWLSVGYDFETTRWLDFARFIGSCDRSDPPVAVGLNTPGRQLSLSHFATDQDVVSLAESAPQFPLIAWAKLDVYVNFADGSLVVWQDDALVASAVFARSTTDVCYLEFGTMASSANSDLVTFADDVRLVRLEEALATLSTPPKPCGD
jgi:hypothetical protein